MPAPFTATADELRCAAEFLESLGAATENTGVIISDTFTVQLSEEGSSIEAQWDGANGRYVLSDRVGG